MAESASILEQLTALLGEERCVPGASAPESYSDVYRSLEVPLAVARPNSVGQVQALLRLAAGHGLAICVRGGGASYTDGYLARDPHTLLLDLSGLNRIVEINEEDCYVTVEAGVTWAVLCEAVEARGWRTPFRGPFSGLHATIGGSLSQNSLSHGSGAWGISAESVLSCDLVTSDGRLLSTGSAALGAGPFSRHFGPDLAGLFSGDCGALGIKVRITLPLIRLRPEHEVASFAFPDFASMHEAMRLVARERLDESQFALDQALSQGQIARQDRAGERLRMAWTLLRSSPSLPRGVAQLLRAGLSARKQLGEAAYMVHYIVEGVDKGEARGRIHRIRQLLGPLGGEIAATVPSVVRGMRYAPFFNTLGPGGERWVPLHGILPHSRVGPFHEALVDFYEQRQSQMRKFGIWAGAMFSTVGSGGFLYEVALYWPDEISAYHRSVVPADYLQSLPSFPANAEARSYVHELKEDLARLYADSGASHFQIGRFYSYRDRLAPGTAELLDVIKQHLDPDCRLSPGVLGFEPGQS